MQNPYVPATPSVARVAADLEGHGTELAQTIELELVFSALDTANFGLCAIGSDERVLMMTSAFGTKLGADPVDALGANARSLLSHRLTIAEFGRVIDVNEPSITVEVPVTGPNGEVALLLLQAHTSRRKSREAFRVLSVIEVADFGVTPTRMQQLRRQLDALNSAMVISDCRSPDMPILYVNDRFRALTGYSPDEVIGRNCRFLQGTDTDQPALVPLREAIAAKRGGYAVLRNYRRNGEMFMNELLVSPIRDASGTVTHMVALQREQSARV